jgi:hypothetical protein
MRQGGGGALWLSNGGQSVDGGRRGKMECASGGKVSSELDTDIVSGSG